MYTYHITIKDLSAITTHTRFECTINAHSEEEATQLVKEQYADLLDTTPESIEILSIIKQ